jgi:hypothetical protein
MYKTVYMHKTTFGFEALLRHILFVLRERGAIYPDGNAVESMILTDDFLAFHDGYVDGVVQKFAKAGSTDAVANLCNTLKERKPPRLLHEVAVLHDSSEKQPNVEHALFCQNRVDKIKGLAQTHKIPVEFWIWEDPKDVSFESLGPFIPLSQAADITPEETAELIRIRSKDGTVRQLVEDRHSVIHHLSKLRLQMSRLYLAAAVDENMLQKIKDEVKAWSKPN